MCYDKYVIWYNVYVMWYNVYVIWYNVYVMWYNVYVICVIPLSSSSVNLSTFTHDYTETWTSAKLCHNCAQTVELHPPIKTDKPSELRQFGTTPRCEICGRFSLGITRDSHQWRSLPDHSQAIITHLSSHWWMEPGSFGAISLFKSCF